MERRCMMTASPTFAIGSPFDANVEVATASSENGMSVAVWTSDNVNSDSDVFAQLYRADGSEVGAILNVATTNRDEFEPSVAMDDDGNFVVAWTEEDSSGDKDVRARRFSSTPNSLGSTVNVATGSRDEYQPDIAMDASGRFVVSYTKDQPLYTTIHYGFGSFTVSIGNRP